jgi:hypothetical protein
MPRTIILLDLPPAAFLLTKTHPYSAEDLYPAEPASATHPTQAREAKKSGAERLAELLKRRTGSYYLPARDYIAYDTDGARCMSGEDVPARVA